MAGGLPDVQVTDQRDQTWEGFGGCFNELGWTALSALPAPERRRVLRALFDRAAGEDVRCGAALPPRSFNTFVFAPRSRQREASS
jgi:O-glycosyl hydrolase